MRKLNSIVVAAALLIGTSAFANEKITEVEKTPATEQLGDLLENPAFLVLEDTMADVTFMLNNAGEVVVLSVETENVQIEKFVKSRLNYQKLQKTNLVKGKEYKVPVKIVSES